MRSLLLTGVAASALFLAGPSISFTDTTPNDARRDFAGFDPLTTLQSICRTGTNDGSLTRRGLFVAAASAYAQTMPAGTDTPPPLIEGVAANAGWATVGDVARPYFEQGLGLMYGFNHAEAVRAFRAAQSLDPDCAICFWGEAYALGPNINKLMDPADNSAALAAARAALEKAAGATDAERALIEAIAVRYVEDAAADRGPLDAAYAEAMKAAADRFPEHDELQALAAEAIMDAQPWDYWEPGGRTPKGDAGDALRRLDTVIARNPQHILAIHLHIHMTEASDNPWRSVPYAERLAGLAPGAGHLVHMPSHTWYRIGRFVDSLAANIDAVAVDEAYLDEVGEAASPIYRFGYYPHNVHFALTSAQMAGDAETALEMAGKLDQALPMEMADLEGWIQLIKAGPLFARIQFGDTAELERVLTAPAPEAAPAYVEAAWRYARGEANARLGNAEAARDEAAALEALDAATDWDEAMSFMPAPDLVQIMRHTVLARAAMAEDDLDGAIEHLAEATDLQAKLPYLEPPFWWYPARQTFAAALLMDGQAERAEQEFFATLVESPDNGWAYWGLAEARAAQGDAAGAEAARVMWRGAWAGDEPPTLEKL